MGYVVYASMVNSIGEVATAAHTIANTVESAFYIPGYGMQTAAATLIGNAYGAKDSKRMKDVSSMFLPIEVVLMTVSGGLLFAFAPSLMEIFSDSREVIELGTAVLCMVALSEPFYGVSIIVEGMMQGVGKTKAPFVYNIMGMWLIRIVGTYLCTQMFAGGLVAAWGCMILHNMFLFVLFHFRLYMYILLLCLDVLFRLQSNLVIL
jgi:Na+-driven multidrug efflux pump